MLQLAQNSNITVTIIHFVMPIISHSNKSKALEAMFEITRTASGSQLAISQRIDTGARYADAAQDTAILHTLRDSLSSDLTNRVVFVDVPTTTPVADCLIHAREEIAQSPQNAGDLIVCGRGQHSFSLTAGTDSLSNPSGAEMRKTLGIVAESLISSGIRGSVLVIQAGGHGLND